MGPRYLPTLPSRGSAWYMSLTLAVLVGTMGVISTLDQADALETGRSPDKAGAAAALKQNPQVPKEQVGGLKQAAPSLIRDNEIPNNANNNNNANNAADSQYKRQGGYKIAQANPPQQAADRGAVVNHQVLAQQQKERLAESMRLNNELQKKMRLHEQAHQKKEQQLKERELQRQQRQQMLEEYRKAEQNKKAAQNRQKEKEQKWLDDVEKKSIAKLRQQQQQQGEQVQQQQAQQQALNVANPNVPNLTDRVKGDAAKGDNNLPRNIPPKRVASNNSVNNLNNNNNDDNSNKDNGDLSNLHNNNNNNRLARDPNSGGVKEVADLEGNRVLPVVKYPRDDGTFNNNNNIQNNINNNNNNNDAGNGMNAQDSKQRQHDSPEVNNQEAPVIRVEERQDSIRGGAGRSDVEPNINNNDNSNNNNNNNEFNNNNNNNFNNFDNSNRDSQQNGDFPDADNGEGNLGGLHINWDWDDFSIMFDNYGRAEMKVRRAPKSTTGEPWPMPQYYSKKEKKIYKIGKDLRFMPMGVTCDVLEEAMARHLQRILKGSVEDMYDNLQNAEGSSISDPTLRYEKNEFVKAPTINRVELKVRKPCSKYPTLESDESYDLVVKKKKTFIYANEVWGLLRGLETLGHLVWRGTDGVLYIKETVISDYPRFAHRGLHIDTSRHYLFKEVLLDIIDSMEMNKFNVFHWHLVDDQSFPYESKVFPELSRKGAFHPTYVYTLEDIAELIEYARLRGIRVLPEFDTPGHTYAWGLGRPELLTQCYSDKIPVKGYLGPLDPSKNSTYRFLHSLFQEVMSVFKDTYLHLGGDEVPLGCWQSNPEVMAFANELARKNRLEQSRHPQQQQQQQQQMQQLYYNSNSWSQWSDEIKQVYEYYENRLIKMLLDISRKRKKPVHYIMWQEVINNNLQLPNDTIIQVWMGDMADVMRATSMGYRVIYSTCWYLDHIEYGTKWPKYYQCDPVDQSYGYHIDEKKVLGGEAAFWSEYFSNENLIPLMWPRASAVAERLWSNKEVKNLDKAAERLSEHRCRMIKRGINAGEISGPGYCLHSPPKRRLFNETMGCKGGNCSRSHNFVEIEDIQVHLSQRGGSLTDCGKLFHHSSSSVPILLAIILVLVLALVAVTRSSSRLHRMRLCKNRFILLAFVVLLLIYFLCYTTIWMRAFEFSGSIHKTVQEDKSDKSGRAADSFNEQNFLPS